MYSIDIASFATHYSLKLTRSVRLAHALFFGTFLFQVLNTALRHNDRGSGYWFYILILEGPIMLLNLFVIYSIQQWWSIKKNMAQSVAVLWSYGSLTMPSTETVSHDIQLAAIVPLASLLLFIFWLFVYVLFEDDDDGYFDDTFWNGVDLSEMSSFEGVLDNIAAQAAWRCFTLTMFGLILPAYPMSATALWAGIFCQYTNWNHSKIAQVTDMAGAVMASIIFLVGIYETFWDDNNGVGIWHFFNAGVLLVFTVPRLFSDKNTDASGHVLMGRPCYQEKEAEGAEGEPTTTTDTMTTIPAVVVPPSVVMKEQELAETTTTTTTTAAKQSSNGGDDDTPAQKEIV